MATVATFFTDICKGLQRISDEVEKTPSEFTEEDVQRYKELCRSLDNAITLIAIMGMAIQAVNQFDDSLVEREEAEEDDRV